MFWNRKSGPATTTMNKRNDDLPSANNKSASSSFSLLESLSDELLRHVLSWLTPLELLQSTALVSKRFAKQILHDGDDDVDDHSTNEDTEESSFWRTVQAIPQNRTTLRFTQHQLQRYSMFETARKQSSQNNNNSDSSRTESDFVARVPSCLKYGSVLVSKELNQSIRALHREGQRTNILVGNSNNLYRHGSNRVCLASTTDHEQNEALEHVLPRDADDDRTERFYMTIQRRPRGQQTIIRRLAHPFRAAAADDDDGNHNEVLVRRGDPHNPRQTDRWWSSRPTPRPDGRQERLLFTLRYPECLLTEVWIKPLRDPYVGSPVYSWKYTKIQAYRLPLRILGPDRHHAGMLQQPQSAAVVATNDDNDVDDDIDVSATMTNQQSAPVLSGSWTKAKIGFGPSRVMWNHYDFDLAMYSHSGGRCSRGIVQISTQGIQPPERWNQPDDIMRDLIEGQVPVYESPEPQPVLNANSGKLLKYTLPTGVVANVIVLTLIGKNHEQFDGSGYYACVERVDCRGIPLYPHPSVEL